MIQTLAKNWWLLALCGVLDAIISVTYVIIYTDLGPSFSGVHSIVVFQSRLILAAGGCTIAAGIWRSARGKSWLAILNGVAFSAYGLLPLVWRGPLRFNVFALLLVVMAMTFGILAFAIARTLRRHVADKWFLGLAGAVSVGFALAFLALGRPVHPSVFLWLCSYFGFSAICMLGLALHLPRFGPSQSGQWEGLPSLGHPKHAH
jgi:hypothetical protein